MQKHASYSKKILIYKYILFFFIISSPLLQAQEIISKYENLLNLQNVIKTIVVDDVSFSICEGGLFSYNFANGSYKIYTKSNGLSSQNPTAIAVDKHKRIWIGHSNGMIDILKQNRKDFEKIFDIKNSTKTSRKINYIYLSGDTALIATDFGASLIDINKLIFYDTAVKFSTLNADLSVNCLIKYNNRIIAGLDQGLAISRPQNSNLTSPDSWNVFTVFNGLPSNRILSLENVGDTLFIGTSNGLSLTSDFETFLAPFPGLENHRILDLYEYKNNLYILAKKDGDPYSILVYNGIHITGLNQALRGAYNSIYMHNSRMLVSTTYGLVRLDEYFVENSDEIYAPDGPASNIVVEIAVDNKGNLWCASGNNDLTSRGFYKYDGFKWENFNLQTAPIISTNSYYKVSAGKSGNVYLSSWGFGLTIYKNKELIRIDNSTYPDLIGNTQTYIVIGGVGEDSEGNIWFLNAHSLTRRSLYKMDKNGNLTYFENPYSTQTYLNAIHLVIDQYDTKWITTKRTSVNATDGLFFFNEKRTLSGALPSGWGKANLDAEGSTSRSVNAIALDKRGELWVGRSLGVNIISNLLAPNSRISSVFALRQYGVNCIAVDALNQKWIGTNSGLFLLSSDGGSIIAHLTSDNSPLISDNILSIAIEEKKGIIYIASDNGITALYTPFVKGEFNFNNLSVYPNPFIISEYETIKLTITGLQANSKIKIFDINGKQIREIKTIGGGIEFWDGKNDEGEFVGSGIYIIAAVNQNSSESGLVKVAVIRKK